MRSLTTSTIDFTTRACRMGVAWTTITTMIGITSGGSGCDGEMD
jgi:hypothetical protein